MTNDPAGLLRAHKASVAAVGLVLLLVGLAQAHDAWTEPVQERRSVERSRWSEDASFTYRVPVTRNATAWPEGTVLPMGMPAYFRTITDHIPVEFRWRAEGAEGLAEARMRVVVRAETPQGRTYWEIERPLASELTRDPSSGLVLQGVLPLDELVGEVAATANTLPVAEGRINWSVEAVVTYALRSPAGPGAGTSRHVLPMQVSDPRFTLPAADDLRWRRPHVDVEVVTLSHPAGRTGLLAALPAQALLLGGLGLVLAAAWAHRTDPDRGASPRDVAYRREHERHRDWVTPLEAPLDERALPRPLLDVPSLQDLVQAAADARARIVLDPARRVYYVLAPAATYRYAKHATPPAPAKPVRARSAARPRLRR